jgi:hypothetical protein
MFQKKFVKINLIFLSIKRFDFQLCMLVNDIEYVKKNVLSSLPKLLNFTSVIDKMIENYESQDFLQTKITLERLISAAEHEMTDVIKLIFDHVAKAVHVSLQTRIANYYRDEKRGKSEVKTKQTFLLLSFF